MQYIAPAMLHVQRGPVSLFAPESIWRNLDVIAAREAENISRKLLGKAASQITWLRANFKARGHQCLSWGWSWGDTWGPHSYLLNACLVFLKSCISNFSHVAYEPQESGLFISNAPPTFPENLCYWNSPRFSSSWWLVFCNLNSSWGWRTPWEQQRQIRSTRSRRGPWRWRRTPGAVSSWLWCWAWSWSARWWCLRGRDRAWARPRGTAPHASPVRDPVHTLRKCDVTLQCPHCFVNHISIHVIIVSAVLKYLS